MSNGQVISSNWSTKLGLETSSKTAVTRLFPIFFLRFFWSVPSWLQTKKCSSTNISTICPNWSSMLRCKSLSSVSTWEWSSSTRIPHHILVYRWSPFSWGQKAISSMKWTSPGHNRSISFNRGKGLLCGIKPLNTSQGGTGILCVCAWLPWQLGGGW